MEKQTIPVISTKNLSVGYQKTIVIDGISIEISPRQIFTLIGPNGAGKSTILKTITGQLKKQGGTIFVKNSDSDTMTGELLAKEISMVMTSPIKTELMTCRDVVATGRYPYTGRMGILTASDWQKVDDAIKLVHAEEVADKYFTQISDGQRQRVMLARAICQDTGVLILDEPTSYLDIRYKLDILNNIRKLARKENKAIVMSLHELDLAAKISDITACVCNGKVDKVGSPEEIFTGNYIQKIYGVPDECFEPLTGQMFLEAVHQPEQSGEITCDIESEKETQSIKKFGDSRQEKKTAGEKVAQRNAVEKDNTSKRIFVIGGAESAIATYNKLYRENISFVAGIIYENDIEYPTARALAEYVVSEKAFYPISDEKIECAKRLIDESDICICTLSEFAPLNEHSRILYDYAKSCGKL